MRWAIVDATSTVVNVVVWDGGEGWAPPSDCVAHQLADGQLCDIGWTFDPVAHSYAAPIS